MPPLAPTATADTPVAVEPPALQRLPLRVVFLTHYIPLYMVRVLQELTRQIDDFQILLSTPIEPNRHFEPDWSGLNVSVQRTWTMRQRWKHDAGFADPLFVHLPLDTDRRLAQIRPDVVVSHELGFRSMLASRYCHRSGAKLVLATFMSEHTERGRGRFRESLRRRLIASADAVTANGPSCHAVLRRLGANPANIYPFPYAADDRCGWREVKPTGSELRNRLICIGQLSQRKGVLPFVESLTEYCDRQQTAVHLTLVGSGPLRERLERRRDEQNANRLQTGLFLDLLGNIPAKQLPGLIARHDAVVAPTLADEWLLVVDEAMHAGVPVIGSVHAQAVTTLVHGGRTGWQYDPLRDRSIDPALDQLRSLSTPRWRAMSDRCRVAVAGRTPESSASGLLAAISSVVASGV